MLVTGPIEGWDMGWHTGIAVGAPGAAVQSCAVALKKPNDPPLVGYANLVALIQDRWSEVKPVMVVAEAPLALGAYLNKDRNAASFERQIGMHAILMAMCGRYRVQYRTVAASTARKHFLGVAHFKGRDETNAAVVNRCRLMKLVPPDCSDWDRCSAICIHDWACASFGQRSTSIRNLYLVGETAKP